MATTIDPTLKPVHAPDKVRRVMSELNENGDTKITWDADNADEVAAARAQFDALKKKGFLAFSVDRKGEQDERLTRFDPEAEKIILVPQTVGG